MGTDITMFAERRTPQGWVTLDDVTGDDEREGDRSASSAHAVPIYDTRNSDLFVILGYNGGISVSQDTIDMVAPLRGLPPDLSPQLKDWVEEDDYTYCGTSWLLMSELLAVDWAGKRARREAMVSQRVAPLFDDPSRPFPVAAWPADEPIIYSMWSRDGVVVQWTDTYADIAGEEFLGVLERLASLGDPNDTRVVFWFDC